MIRPVTEVACGVLIDRGRGRYLLGSRPEDKPYAGYWEFPGGKLEAGETVQEALSREFVEELGIVIGPSYPWFVMEHDYPHAYVRLHYRRIYSYTGEIVPQEGQKAEWFSHPLTDNDLQLLPMVGQITRRICLPAVLQRGKFAEKEGGIWLGNARGVWVKTREEADAAADAGCDFAVQDQDATENLFAGQESHLPVYVRGSADGLEEIMRSGAHGVIVD